MMRRFRLQLLMTVIVAVSVLAGCSSSTISDQPYEDFQLSLTLDKSVYRPGEAILATVSLYNNTSKSIDLPELDAQSVVFWFGRVNDPEKMERRAVSSEKDPKGRIRPLSPGESVKRQFLVTTLTHYGGQLSLQAHFDPTIPMVVADVPRLYSNSLQYDVSGPRLFERDGAGFLEKSEAIGLARAKAGRDVTAADAIFVKDEMGFYKCWVNLKVADDQYISYLVDPYIGKVWSEAKPFNPALIKDKRRDPKVEKLRKAGVPHDAGPFIE